MVFLSPYRSSRLVAPTFMKNITDRTRAMSEWYTNRPWASGYMIYISDARMPIAVTCTIYYMTKYFQSVLDDEEYDKVVINRWGGSIEAVRQNLTPEDYVRARAYFQWEKGNSVFLAPKMINMPEGMDLPGPAPAHH